MNCSLNSASRRLMTTIVRPALAAFVVGLAACGTNTPTGTNSTSTSQTPAAPTGGWLTLQLTTPRSNDGAVQFVVSGPTIDSARVISYNGFATSTGSVANMVVTGQVASGTVGQIYVPDLSRTGEYQASVLAAAARDSYTLQDVSGYRAVLVR
jgi:hypothetical protein